MAIIITDHKQTLLTQELGYSIQQHVSSVYNNHVIIIVFPLLSFPPQETQQTSLSPANKAALSSGWVTALPFMTGTPTPLPPFGRWSLAPGHASTTASVTLWDACGQVRSVAHLHKDVNINRRLRARAHTHIHTHTYTRARAHTHTHTHTHTRTHTRTHTHARTHAHTHTHTYARARAQSRTFTQRNISVSRQPNMQMQLYNNHDDSRIYAMGRYSHRKFR